MGPVVIIPSIHKDNFTKVFKDWVWNKIKISQNSAYYKEVKKQAQLHKVADVFKNYIFENIGNRFDLANKVLKNSDLLANILPYEGNYQYETQKATLEALIYYSTKLLFKENSNE